MEMEEFQNRSRMFSSQSVLRLFFFFFFFFFLPSSLEIDYAPHPRAHPSNNHRGHQSHASSNEVSHWLIIDISLRHQAPTVRNLSEPINGSKCWK